MLKCSLTSINYLELSPFVASKSTFVTSLAMTSVQLFDLDAHYNRGHGAGGISPLVVGLPHLAAGWARAWGRDICIAFKGLFLLPGHFYEAREVLMFLASCVRHGLVPNLLDAGRNPRYNSRDAAWWFLQSVQDYCEMSPEGLHFLTNSVIRRFPVDDQDLHRELAESNQLGITFTISDAIQVCCYLLLLVNIKCQVPTSVGTSETI